MSGQSDPATEFIAYASVLLLFLYFLSVGIGKVSEWRKRRRDVPEPEPARSPQVNRAEPERTPGSGSAELALNADELAAAQRMIKHNATARSPSKSSTIAAGFGVSRGGSATYQRASVIYDALFGQPEPAVQYSDPEHGGRVPASYPVSGRR